MSQEGSHFSPFSLRNFPTAKSFFDPGVSVFVRGIAWDPESGGTFALICPVLLDIVLEKTISEKKRFFSEFALARAG